MAKRTAWISFQSRGIAVIVCGVAAQFSSQAVAILAERGALCSRSAGTAAKLL